jgi:hypothetical protein
MIDDTHERAAALDGAAYLLGQLAARMQRDAATLLRASAALLSGEQRPASVAAVLHRYAEDGHQLCAAEVNEVARMIHGTLSSERPRKPRTQPAPAARHKPVEETPPRISFKGPEWQRGGRNWVDAMTQAAQLSEALVAAIRKAGADGLEENEKKYLFRLATSADGALVRWRFLQPGRHRAAAFGKATDSRDGEIVRLFGGTTDEGPNHAA